MAGAGVLVALGIAGPAANTYSLWLGGLDIWALVDRTSLHVLQSGTLDTGSAASFTIVDTTLALGRTTDWTTRLAWGTEVVLYDHQTGLPLFGGWLNSVESSSIGANQGFEHRITCVGWDACLDWSWVGSHPVFFAGGSTSKNTARAIQSVLGNWLNYPLSALGSTSVGDTYHPSYGLAGSILGVDAWPYAYLQADVDVSNMSVRSALRAILEASAPSPAGGFDVNGFILFVGQDKQLWFTDLYFFGLPVTSGPTPSKVDLTDHAEYITAAQMTVRQDNSNLADLAYVNGGNAAGTGYVSSPQESRHSPARVWGISEADSTTATLRDLFGASAIAGRRSDWDIEWVVDRPTTVTSWYMGSADSAILNGTYSQVQMNPRITSIELTWPLGYTRPRYVIRGIDDRMTGLTRRPATSWLRRRFGNLLEDLYQRR